MDSHGIADDQQAPGPEAGVETAQNRQRQDEQVSDQDRRCPWPPPWITNGQDHRVQRHHRGHERYGNQQHVQRPDAPVLHFIAHAGGYLIASRTFL
jgi:hypothetical protein